MPSHWAFVAALPGLSHAVNDPLCFWGSLTTEMCCGDSGPEGGNAACWDGLYNFRRCCEAPFTMAGVELRFGPPSEQMGSELMDGGTGNNTWVGKNSSNFADFIHLRMQYVEDQESFAYFRSTVHSNSNDRNANDGFYSKADLDSVRMLELMEGSPFGRALLQVVLPRVHTAIDGFGSPALYRLGGYGLASSDLFNMLFKLQLILASFQEFEVVDDLLPPLPAEDLQKDAGQAKLLREWDIVEVGAGPGLHAATLVAALGARSYSIVDLPTQQALQHKVLVQALGEEVVNRTFAFVPCCRRPVPGSYVLASYDLFISTYAFSELDLDSRMVYFYCFIIQSKRGFIIDNYEDIHETRRLGPHGDLMTYTTAGGAGGERDSGQFTGLDLVWRLQDAGFDVRIRTKNEVLGVPLHRSRTVVITWAATGVDMASLQKMRHHGGI